MTYDTIRFTCQDGVGRLVLHRPDKLNSFNDAMHAEVRDALQRAADDDAIRCLVLTGAGRGFCAGQDLGDRDVSPGAAPPDLEASIRDRYNPLVRSITTLAKPVICAVNGVAAGAGANIALACDLVIAARSASFIQAFCRIGLLPDSGGTWQLPHLVGRARAMGLALLGERLGAAQAAEWGLIWKCVDDELLESDTESLARHLASQPTLGLGMIKRAINQAPAHTLERQLDLEAEMQGVLGRSEDYREGVAAFIAKRPPVFKGR